MSKGKIVLFTLVFAVASFVVPLVLLMMFVSADNIGAYFAVFGIVFFASVGFLCATVISVKKEVLKAISEIKVQNAAIAYRLAKEKGEQAPENIDVAPEGKIDTSKINLNPETPLNDVNVKSKKIVNDDFDDFK